MCNKIKSKYRICWICGCTDMIPTIDGDWLCPSCDKVDKDRIK